MNELEKFAKELYEQEPIYEREQYSEDDFDFWMVEWEDIHDNYPATYEYYLEQAMNIYSV